MRRRNGGAPATALPEHLKRDGIAWTDDLASGAQLWRLNVLGLLPEMFQRAGAQFVDDAGDPVPFVLGKREVSAMLEDAKDRGLW